MSPPFRVAAVRSPALVGPEIFHEHSWGQQGGLSQSRPRPPEVDVVPALHDDAGRLPVARSIELQRWEGTIEEVGEDSFTAVLRDLTAQGADEWAELLLDDVAESDRALVAPGAVFYWWIGYRESVSGRTRASVIRLRRLPGITDAELEASAATARRRLRAWGHDRDALD
jgi:hypothetical protein